MALWGGFHNFMKSMEGYEESPYKIITTIFSYVAKENGLNRVAELIDDLGIHRKNYSENLSIRKMGIIMDSKKMLGKQ